MIADGERTLYTITNPIYNKHKAYFATWYSGLTLQALANSRQWSSYIWDAFFFQQSECFLWSQIDSKKSYSRSLESDEAAGEAGWRHQDCQFWEILQEYFKVYSKELKVRNTDNLLLIEFKMIKDRQIEWVQNKTLTPSEICGWMFSDRSPWLDVHVASNNLIFHIWNCPSISWYAIKRVSPVMLH